MSVKVDDLARGLIEWLDGSGDHADIIISSRVRLARNFDDNTFPHRADDPSLQGVLERAFEAAGKVTALDAHAFFPVHKLSKLDLEFLMERHLISPQMKDQDRIRGLVVSQGEGISVMINEEDHLRLQAVQSGLELDKAWTKVSQVERELGNILPFASSEELGWLTACPTNVGTGLRVSIFCHLPAVTLTGEVDKIFESVIPSGIAIRGFYGEGSGVMGNIFQISNQITLGVTEQEILRKVQLVAQKFIEVEEGARKKLMKEAFLLVMDKIHRALAILTSARLLTLSEFMDLFSALRLGVDLGVVRGLSRGQMNQIMLEAQPAHIQKLEGKVLKPLAIDAVRARMVKRGLIKVKVKS